MKNTKNYSQYQPWNINDAIETARGFEQLGKSALNSSDQLSLGIGLAGGVNYAIAIELYIKIIYFLDKGYLTNLTKSHKLASIYDEISSDLKSEMLLDFQVLAEKFDQETLEVINQEQDILRGYLAFSEKICVNWRYYGLDSKKPPVSGFVYVNDFLNILKSQITKLKQLQ